MKKIFVFLLLITLLSGCNNTPPAERIRLNALFTDNMVLQQEREIPVWGRAEPGHALSVTFAGHRREVVTDHAGRWKVIFPPVTAGGPYKMIIAGRETDTLRNILVGEVWLASGQSNMEMPVGGWGKIKNYREEIVQARHPMIRLFQVDKKTAFQPRDTFSGSGWKVCSPESVEDFSAVAYFFGRKLNRDLNVPVGIIQSAWGGTVVEAWTCGKTLKRFPVFRDTVAALEKDHRSETEIAAEQARRKRVWPDRIEEILKNTGTLSHGYQEAGYPIAGWPLMTLPSLWEEAGLPSTDGVVWFSREVTVPATWQGKELTLSLGRINDYDITWFNGHRVGRGTDVAALRTYTIPPSLAHPGRNRITVEVMDIGNVGGLYGPPEKMFLACGNEKILLTGEWKYIPDPVKIDVKKLPEKPDENAGANAPTVLYNAMIRPLIPYAFRGVIWYQGESNAGRAWQYRRLFPALIRCWRRSWHTGDFPFLYVQLANFMDPPTVPGDDAWAELREAQTLALQLPNTGMAVTLDIGDARDIHPKNKQEVGRRLALIALAQVYGEKIPYSGPLCDTIMITGDSIRIRFRHAEGGLQTCDHNPPEGFAIAAVDRHWVWARAHIDGEEVVVWSPGIKKPVAVRYAWAANPRANLCNGAGLPASPFRTDDWPGITYGRE